MPEMVDEDLSVAARAAAATRQLLFLCLMLGVTGFQFLFVMVQRRGRTVRVFELWQTVLLYAVVIDALVMQFAMTYLRCVVLRNTFMARCPTCARCLRSARASS